MDFATLASSDFYLWLNANRHWLGVLIALIAMAESLAVLGVFLPGVVLLGACALLAGSIDYPLWQALGFACLGAIIGDVFSFWLGHRFHQGIRRQWPFHSHPQWIDRGEVFFARFGWMSVVIGRFVGALRPIIPMVAGMLDMPARTFILVNMLSALLWAPVYILPGYLAGKATHWPYPPEQLLWAVLACGGLLTLVFWTVKQWQKRRS